MSRLVLQPRISEPGSLTCWFGAFDTPPGALRWTLDGGAATPQTLRTPEPAHPFGAKAFTGVFRFSGVSAGRHRITVAESGGGTTALNISTVPAQIPRDDWLRIQLVSCYHRAEDGGHLSSVIEGLSTVERPDLSILMGDQVYLDLPTIANFPDDEAKLARRFETQYTKNWTERRGLAAVLGIAPSVCAPDDHEYWNNYPHAATVIQNSWTAKGRERWGNAADAVFGAFQRTPGTSKGESVVFDIDPISFLVLNQRTARAEDTSSALTPAALDHLDSWVDDLIANGKYGAVVSGQPFLDKAAGRVAGKFVDRTLLNYGDYPRVVRSLVRLADAGRPAILVTGDVHWGRVTEIRDGAKVLFYEVICSPAALVSSVGADQLKTIGSAITGLFGGGRKRWPRHSKTGTPPPVFAQNALSPRKLDTEVIGPSQVGDQIATLCLRQAGGGLDMKVVYREVHKRPNRPVETKRIKLRRRP